VRKPALLGGKPAFPEKLRLFRPTMPTADELRPYIDSIQDSGWQSNFGPISRRFEEILADRLRVKHCLTLANLSSGLMYMPAAAGLDGGEVIVPSFTFLATAHSMKLGGLTPVFADINPRTLTLDPASVEAAIGPDTVAICGVHIFGTPCDIPALQAISEKHNLVLLFDAAQALGSTHRGAPVGSFGLAEGFSASATKILTTLGEGGFICTNDDAFADHVRLARNWGQGSDYNPKFASICSKMPEINAAAGIIEIGRFENYLADRRATAERLIDGLGAIPGIGFPIPHEGDTSAHKELPILIDAEAFGINSFLLAEALDTEGIDSRKYFHPCLHRTDVYQDTDGAKRVPLDCSEWVSSRILSIPFYTHMDSGDVDRLCAVVGDLHKAVANIRDRA